MPISLRLFSLALSIIVFTGIIVGSPLVSSQEPHMSWIHPGYDRWNSGFSPQNTITHENIRDLELKWVYQFRESPELDGAVPPEGIQTTPLIFQGIVYVASGYNELIAIETSSGRELWSFKPDISLYGGKSFWAGRLAIRSLTIHDGAVYIQTSDCSIYGLELTTGEILFSLLDTCKDIPGTSGKYFGTFAPIFFENLLITRAQGNAFGGRGFVSAYDMDSKEIVWRWFSVPPEDGADNWGIIDAAKGNMNPYNGDWGNSSLIAGGTSWGLIALDENDGRIYFLTGEPSNQFDAMLRPGPNLFSNSIVSLNAKTGEMIWYYQVTPHDISNHDPGWKVLIAEIENRGKTEKVVITASKSNFIYVLDAESGKPIYDPVHFGPPNFNTLNENAGNDADMMASQSRYIGEIFCPSHLGGVFSAPAIAYDTIYISSQNVCSTVVKEKLQYKGQIIDGFRYNLVLDLPTNGTIYAIGASDGLLKWSTFIPNRIQSAALTVSGGVVYAVDRAGVFYAIDANTGSILREIPFNAIGSAGIAIGGDAKGNMMLIIPVGGSQLVGKRSGVLVAMGLSENTSSINISKRIDIETSPRYMGVVLLALLIITAVSVGYTIQRRYWTKRLQ